MTRYNWTQIGEKTLRIYEKSLEIPPKSFTRRFNDFGRVTFNGKFYQALLIIQHCIFFIRKHSSFETVFYSIVLFFSAVIGSIKHHEIKMWSQKSQQFYFPQDISSFMMVEQL